ncbi:MAG: hypothetical protein ACYCXI_10220 [Dethiobacteraceae bacterium]
MAWKAVTDSLNRMFAMADSFSSVSFKALNPLYRDISLTDPRVQLQRLKCTICPGVFHSLLQKIKTV